MRVAVTGAYGYSGQYMTRRLLGAGHEVLAVTSSLKRANPFGERVRAVPYDFAQPDRLESSLRGVDVLINNYWVRFDRPPLFTHARAVANARVLFDAAKRAGLGRIVHISMTNPEEIRALMEERLYVASLPLGTTRLSDWLRGSARALGRPYTSEMARRLDRRSPYRSNKSRFRSN